MKTRESGMPPQEMWQSFFSPETQNDTSKVIADPSKLAEELDSAFQGQEGLALIRQALAENRPYAMAFVDVRMPPGWDGVETIARIWEEYPDLQPEDIQQALQYAAFMARDETYPLSAAH